MQKQELFCKLVVANIASCYINQHRTALQQELYTKANDPVLLRRRFRMISQLADYESQIYKKIYNFQSSNTDDYFDTVNIIIGEISHVTDRNG